MLNSSYTSNGSVLVTITYCRYAPPHARMTRTWPVRHLMRTRVTGTWHAVHVHVAVLSRYHVLCSLQPATAPAAVLMPPRPKPRPPPAASPCGSRPCHTLHASTSPNTGTCASGHAPYMRASTVHALRARIVDRRIILHPRSHRYLPRSRHATIHEISREITARSREHGAA